jgi:hypothetical protein
LQILIPQPESNVQTHIHVIRVDRGIPWNDVLSRFQTDRERTEGYDTPACFFLSHHLDISTRQHLVLLGVPVSPQCSEFTNVRPNTGEAEFPIVRKIE